MKFSDWLNEQGFLNPIPGRTERVLPQEIDWVRSLHTASVELKNAQMARDDEQIARFSRKYEKLFNARKNDLEKDLGPFNYSIAGKQLSLFELHQEIVQFHRQVQLHKQSLRILDGSRRKYGWEKDLLKYPLRDDVVPWLKAELRYQHKWHRKLNSIQGLMTEEELENIQIPAAPYKKNEISRFVSESAAVFSRARNRKLVYAGLPALSLLGALLYKFLL